jgi:hypothetical protein
MDIAKRDVEQWIHDEFPHLRDRSYRVTSLYDDDYNCIAWAVDDTNNWWWPDIDSYWPEHVDRVHTLEAFVEALRTKQFEPCVFDERVEKNYDKIVLFIDHDGKPKHAARQLESGAWTSKLGRVWDIEHDTLRGVECNEYGRAKHMFSRPKAGSNHEEDL